MKGWTTEMVDSSWIEALGGFLMGNLAAILLAVYFLGAVRQSGAGGGSRLARHGAAAAWLVAGLEAAPASPVDGGHGDRVARLAAALVSRVDEALLGHLRHRSSVQGTLIQIKDQHQERRRSM